MSLLLKRVGIPLAERIGKMPVSKYLGELLRTQWLSPEEIREIQNTKLAALIEHAYATVPFYRDTMDERGLKPSDIRTIDDLPKLPILTKDTIRANYPDKMVSTKYEPSELSQSTSSGSTGEPFRYMISRDEKARKWAGLYRIWSWAGYEMGDKWVNLTARPPRAFKHSGLLQRLEARYSDVLGLPAQELYAGNADEFVRRILAFKPRMLRGYTSSLYYLAQVMSDRGVKLNVDIVSTTGETLFDFQRELIESFYGSKAHDGYGGEGMEIAGQCEAVSGYHVNAESVVMEIVDSDGSACPDGVEGQIVLTDLNHYSMPFIRYNIQDVAVRSSKLCSCGRGLPVLDRISGRLTDIGVTPSGKPIFVQFFSIVLRNVVSKVRGFQVVQERPDLITLYVVPGDGFIEVADQIVAQAQDYVGSDVTVELKLVEEIPLAASGKRRLFISKCGMQVAGGAADRASDVAAK